MLDDAAGALARGLTGGLPLLVACATILALLSQRNGHLSDRARGVRQDYEDTVYKFKLEKNSELRDLLKTRCANLKKQHNIFIMRYKRTAKALRIMSASFCAFSLSSWFAIIGPNYPIAVGLSEISVVFGAILFGVGLYLLQLEFGEGHITLELNAEGMD